MIVLAIAATIKFSDRTDPYDLNLKIASERMERPPLRGIFGASVTCFRFSWLDGNRVTVINPKVT